MKMQKKMFRIGQIAKDLSIERFVIRFWEKEFNLKPSRSVGGQRFYTEKDFEVFQQIKQLLYEKKFTIAGAKNQLSLQANTRIIGSKKIESESDKNSTELLKKQLLEQKIEFQQQVAHLQTQLQKLRDLL